MFHSSTQRKHWMFTNEAELSQCRVDANETFQKNHKDKIKNQKPSSYFLSEPEERIICRHYEHLLRDFCRKFRPPMPPSVIGTSCTYFKRFYINSSVMDYHPRYIMLTCVYLACKVEEFNVSITQFCHNVQTSNKSVNEHILNHELLVMQQLNFHLTIHNPYRPLEGFLIDLKTRYSSLKDPELLRKGAEDFLHRSLASDSVLLFSPSQIALAAILKSASSLKMNIDRYVTESLLGGKKSQDLPDIVMTIKRIKQLVLQLPPLNPQQVKQLEQKLENCLNPEHDPDSDIYKQRLKEQYEAEDMDFVLSSQDD